jgi:ComF family protein
MKQLLNKWLKNSQLSNISLIKQAVFKQHCLLCASPKANSPGHPLSNSSHEFDSPSIHEVCTACLNDLPWHPKTSCPQCGLSSDGNVCGSCLNSSPDFDATRAVFLYAYPIDAMMLRYKYGNSLNLGDTFGEFLAEKTNFESVDVIIPMPMHPQRLKERGFNQALEIAKVLTKNYKKKLDYKSVTRQTLTPPQASLPLKERVKNIKGAFKVNADLAGKRIAIVDDVMTTGASLNELAKTLKKAGASHVECWVIARTLPHN